MTVLKKDLHQFDPELFGTLGELRTCAAAGGRDILIIACSDHGTAPDNLSFARSGQLIIVQNMAASIPAMGQSHGITTLASIECAVGLTNVKHAIVCGHLGCKIIPHWLKPQFDARACQDVHIFNRHAGRVVDDVYQGIKPNERMQVIIQEHTLFQLENLQSHASVRRRLEDGRLRLHAWIVDDDTAKIQAYEPKTGQFRAYVNRFSHEYS